MNVLKSFVVLGAAVAAMGANAELVHRGTPVTLVFDQELSSKHAKVGDRVMMHVAHNVVVNGHVIVKAGAREEAIIEKVSGRGKFGKNASIRLTLNPVNGRHDVPVPLQPRNAGSSFKGSRTDHAALAAGAGLVVLGPIGLVGGIFISGKEVHIKPGDKLESEVAHDIRM